MKRYKAITLTLVFFVSILNGQELALEWQTTIESETMTNGFGSPLLFDDHLIFDHRKSESLFADTHTITVVNPSGGLIEKTIDWPSYIPQRSEVVLLKASETEFYFTVDRARSYHYGKMNIDGEVLWNDSLNCAELIPAILGEDLVLDVSCWEGNNELTKVDTDGNVVWSFEFDEYDARNKLYTNGIDRILWLNSQGLSLWDSDAQLISIDSTNVYYESYSDFNIGVDHAVIYLQWGLVAFLSSVDNDLVEMFESDTLNYTYNVFDIPNPTILRDEMGHTFISSDYDYDGRSFLQAYDSDFEPIWNIESTEQVVNIYRDSIYLIVISDSRINILNVSTGVELESFMFESDEIILNRKQKEDYYDSTDKALYYFTAKDSTILLNKLKIDFRVSTTVTTDNIKSYPNPTAGKIWFENIIDGSVVKIFDTSGKEIFETSLADSYIDISHLPNSMYFIQVDESISKFIKL